MEYFTTVNSVRLQKRLHIPSCAIIFVQKFNLILLLLLLKILFDNFFDFASINIIVC